MITTSRLSRCVGLSKRAFSTVYTHVPVLTNEVLTSLNLKGSETVMDMTFGGGGHSRLILDSQEQTRVIAVDRDPYAHEKALLLAEEYPGRVVPILGKYSELPEKLAEAEVVPGSVDCVLFDCGTSSMQFDNPDRGFMVSRDGPLDMRMDGDRLPNQPTAADVLTNIDEADLAKILKVYGEEKYAKKIARSVVESRYLLQKLRTTKEFAVLVANSIGLDARSDMLGRKSHSATKSFQALRIFVNDELNELDFGLQLAHYFLKSGGRVVTITFQSLEDRIVKRHLLGIDMDEPLDQGISQKVKNAMKVHTMEELEEFYEKNWSLLTKDIILPSDSEVKSNPRSRSAKMRVAVKT